MLLEHILIHTWQSFQSRSSSKHFQLCACVPRSENPPRQPPGTSLSKLGIVKSTKWLLHLLKIRPSHSRILSQTRDWNKKYSPGKKGSKLAQVWSTTRPEHNTSFLTFCTKQCWHCERFYFRKFSIKGPRFIPITSSFSVFPASFHFPQHSPHSWQRYYWLGVHGGDPAGKAAGYSQCWTHGWCLSMWQRGRPTRYPPSTTDRTRGWSLPLDFGALNWSYISA